MALMCRVLGVSRSGLYAWRRRPRVPERARANLRLLARIRCVHSESRQTYGSPRVHQQLLREGCPVGVNRIARLMREAGLRGRVRRRYRATTNSDHSLPVAPNTLNREFGVPRRDCVWAGDITYLQTETGWVYLAVIIGLHSRAVVGWSMADHMRTELVVAALTNALGVRRPKRDLLHHSDRGSQYASRSYREHLARRGIRVSMSRSGDCYDNAVVESFFGTLKQELAHHTRWRDLSEARAGIHDYIEVFYNRRRLHSSLGYRTPAEVDRDAA